VAAITGFIALSTSSKLSYDISSFSFRRSARPIEESNNYTATGNTFVLNNMTVYETINKTYKRVLIAAHDIFGLSNNTKQVIDKLADGFGFKIILPDFYRGHEWPPENWPPSDPQELEDWIMEYGNWDKTVKNDTLAIMNHYKTTENVTEFGIFGFCWGGRVSVLASTDIPELKAAGFVHPTNVTNEDAEGVQVPMYLLPTRNEISMLPFYMVLQRKFGTNCGHRRFDDVNHGFAGTGGNFSDPLNRLRVDEAIDILGTFFDRNLLE